MIFRIFQALWGGLLLLVVTRWLLPQLFRSLQRSSPSGRPGRNFQSKPLEPGVRKNIGDYIEFEEVKE
jgi:hypothetical protein